MRAKWDEPRGQTTWGRGTVAYAITVQEAYRQPRKDMPDDHDTDGNPRMAHAIILDYFRQRYHPVFRRGEGIYPEAMKRDVSRTEARQRQRLPSSSAWPAP
jgi:hypothetical protein